MSEETATLLSDELLLRDVKDYLNINWDDDVTNRKIKGFISRGKVAISEYAGCQVTDIDFNKEGNEKQLLFDHCRYARSEALEVFEHNFQSQIVSLRLKYQTEAMEDED